MHQQLRTSLGVFSLEYYMYIHVCSVATTIEITTTIEINISKVVENKFQT